MIDAGVTFQVHQMADQMMESAKHLGVFFAFTRQSGQVPALDVANWLARRK